jgi:adenylate cyclase
VTLLSRMTTFAYRERNQVAADIGAELGATHLIDGSVRREVERVRINVRLVDARHWGEHLGRTL